MNVTKRQKTSFPFIILSSGIDESIDTVSSEDVWIIRQQGHWDIINLLYGEQNKLCNSDTKDFVINETDLFLGYLLMKSSIQKP